MKYTRKEAQEKIDQLDEQIERIMTQIVDIQRNTIDEDKQKLDQLIDLYEGSSNEVKYKLYNYLLDNYSVRFGLFL